MMTVTEMLDVIERFVRTQSSERPRGVVIAFVTDGELHHKNVGEVALNDMALLGAMLSRRATDHLEITEQADSRGN